MLAREVCTLVHGADETARAEQRRGRPVRRRDRPASTSGRCSTCSPTPPPPTWPAPASTVTAPCWSTSWPRRGWSARRARPGTTVGQGGAYVNNAREDDVTRPADPGGPGGRPLRGAAPGQEGPPPGPLRLTGGHRPDRGPGRARRQRSGPTLTPMNAPGDHADVSAVRLTTGLPETVLPDEPAPCARPWATRWPSRGSAAGTPCPTWCGPTPARSTPGPHSARWPGTTSRPTPASGSATTAASTPCGAADGRGRAWSGGPTRSNRGFLRCLDGLRSAAGAIGEHAEEERCAQFLRQLDPAWSPDWTGYPA